jgi:hypothetical protein
VNKPTIPLKAGPVSFKRLLGRSLRPPKGDKRPKRTGRVNSAEENENGRGEPHEHKDREQHEDRGATPECRAKEGRGLMPSRIDIVGSENADHGAENSDPWLMRGRNSENGEESVRREEEDGTESHEIDAKHSNAGRGHAGPEWRSRGAA